MLSSDQERDLIQLSFNNIKFPRINIPPPPPPVGFYGLGPPVAAWKPGIDEALPSSQTISEARVIERRLWGVDGVVHTPALCDHFNLRSLYGLFRGPRDPGAEGKRCQLGIGPQHYSRGGCLRLFTECSVQTFRPPWPRHRRERLPSPALWGPRRMRMAVLSTV